MPRTDSEKLDAILDGMGRMHDWQIRHDEAHRALEASVAEQRQEIFGVASLPGSGLKPRTAAIEQHCRNTMAQHKPRSRVADVFDRVLGTVIAGAVLAVLGTGLLLYATHLRP